MQIVTCENCGTRNRVDEIKLASNEARCGKCAKPLTASRGRSTPIVVTDASFEDEVLQKTGQPVLVDCWAPWCGPCRTIGPIIDQLAAESNGKYKIAKINVDENPGVSSKFRIAGIPTMLIFKDGELVDQLVGAQGKPTILQHLNRFV